MRLARNAFAVLGVVIIVALGVFVHFRHTTSSYPQERYLRFSFTLQNTTKSLIKNAQAWVYGPAKQTAWQLTKSITADAPFVLETDGVGNQILHFTFKKLAPFATKVVTVSAVVMLADKPQHNTQSVDVNTYLKAEPYVETANPQLIALAKSLKKSDRAERISRQNFDWVSSNIKYAGFIKQDRGALYAFKTRSGDCTEYMDLYIALERIDRIPTRGIGGYRVKDNAVLEGSNYHNWAESYLNNAWRIVDPQNKLFLTNENQYIAFRIISYETSKLGHDVHRFVTSGHGLVLKIH